MTARSVAQAAHERIAALVLEIDADYCNNTFGVSPCTATGTQCYNTFGTCKDKSNYSKGTKTFKFCQRGMSIPPGESMRPYIIAHQFSPTEIPPGGGLAVRSQTTLTLVDEVCTDFEADKYAAARSTPAGGTFGTRFLARNYNIGGRKARIKNGYITEPFDWATFQTELYAIESIKGPDGSENIAITLSDVVRPLDKNLLPAPTSGKIAAELKAVEHTGYARGGYLNLSIFLDWSASPLDGAYAGMEVYITQNTGAGQRRVITSYAGASREAYFSALDVALDTTSVYEVSALSINVGAGNGAQYADPATSGKAEFVAIGDEVIRYTAKSGDVLSWSSSIYRAQFGTGREDHDAGDGVQQCFALIDKSATDAIHAIETATGIADAYIDLAGLAVEDTDWLAGARITACIAAPEKASGLLNELLRDLNMVAWWDAVAQKHKFKCDMPQLNTTVKSVTADEIIGGSMQITSLDELRLTQAFISFAPYSATGDMAARENFRITEGFEDVSAEGPNEHNSVIQSQIYSRWLGASNQLFAHNFVARKVRRFRDVPFRAKFRLDPRDEVALGDLFDLTVRHKTDASGAPATTRMRVVKLLDSGNFDVEAVSTQFARRYGFIAPNGYPDYSSATEAQRNYAFIAANTGLMSDGSNAYLIS